jgi:K+-sensing histidine kinase KdpD
MGVWVFGMLILLRGTLNRDVLLFFGQAMTLSTVMFVYWPENTLGLPWGDRVSWFLSNGLYPFTVALVLHFALFFPERHRTWTRKLVPLLYLPPVVMAAWLITALASARATLQPEDVAWYGQAFQVFQVYLAVYFVASLTLWARTYVRTGQFATRQRLKWLFWGFIVGIAPHVLLHELPEGLGLQALLPEEITHTCALLAPASMVVAIIRYRLLDVDLVIQRSIVYATLTLFVVFAYLFLVGLGDWLAINFLGGESYTLVRILVVLLLAGLFAPARSVAHRVVDRVFFRGQYDQRLALMEYSRELASTLDIQELSGKTHALLERVLPTRFLSVFVLSDDEKELVEVYRHPDSDVDGDVDGPAHLGIGEVLSLGLGERERAFPVMASTEELQGVHLLVPLRVDERVIGLIALGEKLSEQSFQEDDLTFVDAVSDQTAIAFGRARVFKTLKDLNVHLEQKVYERTGQLAAANDRLVEQYQKLKKLDELKEALTRMVVHDLKNPVGTILIALSYLDRQQDDEVPEDVGKTLQMIRHTAGEMQELIANLLDVNRMEEGQLALDRHACQVQDVLMASADRVRLLAQYHHVDLNTNGEATKAPWIDRSLMTRVLVNLLTNAVRFSPRDAAVSVSSGHYQEEGDTGLWISVTNRGPVIPENLRDRVFEKFFQASDTQAAAFRGVGLGLTFCKMVVEAHGGRIELQSPAPGQEDGARFTVFIPDKAVSG